ncbi:MAG: HD domain-containing protein [Acidobacteriota bacterium]
MEFEGMETVVIDILRTRELQRLRRIRQMGLGHLVFPGAEHSRFAHSLGTAHLAIRFGRRVIEACRDFLVDELSPDKEAIRDFAVAALCHDLGHGPLSHAWEREIVGEDYDFERWVARLGLSGEKEGLRGAKWHELVGQGFLAWPDGELHRLLEQHEAGAL